MGAGGGPLPTALRGCFGHHMAKGGASLDLRGGLPYGLRLGRPLYPYGQRGVRTPKGRLFVCKDPLGWKGEPESGALGTPRPPSALVQSANCPPTFSGLKKIPACKIFTAQKS